MKKSRELLACLVLLLVILGPSFYAVAALPPLAAATFPAGTIVVPMDDKQADRVHVYGFIHEFLASGSDVGLARIIEPPDVSMQTALTPTGAVYQGGPFLIEPKFLPVVNKFLSNSTFSQVTVTQLTVTFTSNKVFFVRQPTRILVIRGVFGRTDITLDRMGISYTIVDPSAVEANPSLINRYTLIIDDCPGWYGNPSSYAPDRRASIQAVYNAITAYVQRGNEIIFTDIALLDMNAAFPGYIQVADGADGSWQSTVYNPAIGSNFPAEFPSQYYNPGPNANTVKIYTEGGGEVVSSIQPAHASDVRILMDSNNFGIPSRYAILGFYFPVGNGIVEGLAFHPYQQTYPIYADENGYYAVYQLFGNKFVHGPQLDFLLSGAPNPQTVAQGGVASYSLSVTSVGSFSSPVNLQVSGLPPGSTGSISPNPVTPQQGGAITSTLTVSTTLGTPPGTYNLTITGTSTLPLITRSVSVQLIVTPAPADFAIDANPKKPNPLIVNIDQCGNITASVQSIADFNAPVNLTLINRPAHVTSKYKPNPITPTSGGTVKSNLTVCVGPTATPNNYTMTVIGTSLTSSPITHTVDVLLRVPKPSAISTNPLIYLILLTLLFLALGIGLLFLALVMKRKARPAPVPLRVVRRRPLVQYVLPLPMVQCRTCGRIMPVYSVYCPYCGRPQAGLQSAPSRAHTQVRRPGRKAGVGFFLSLLSGILVLLNGAFLLVPAFYAIWSSVFWWLPSIGPSYSFVIGLVIGLVLVFGSIIMLMGNGAIADVLIFPFAVFSLIIGGGLVAGMVLGIVGGIFGALKN